MNVYSGWTESAEAIEARKRRILRTPNLAADEIPAPGECSPLYYAAMTEAQRAEYDKRLEDLLAEREAQPAPVELDRLGMALAIKRQFQGVM